jgi:hypothetical protein
VILGDIVIATIAHITFITQRHPPVTKASATPPQSAYNSPTARSEKSAPFLLPGFHDRNDQKGFRIL